MPPSANEIRDSIAAHQYDLVSEARLQDGIETVLRGAGHDFTREAILSVGERVDFLVGRVAVEVKVAGSYPAVLRQLQRYATSDDVDEVLLVTTKASHLFLPMELAGKPIACCSLLTGSLL